MLGSVFSEMGQGFAGLPGRAGRSVGRFAKKHPRYAMTGGALGVGMGMGAYRRRRASGSMGLQGRSSGAGMYY